MQDDIPSGECSKKSGTSTNYIKDTCTVMSFVDSIEGI